MAHTGELGRPKDINFRAPYYRAPGLIREAIIAAADGDPNGIERMREKARQRGGLEGIAVRVVLFNSERFPD